MIIDVLATPAMLPQEAAPSTLAVVIDALRATTTLSFALGNGADCAIPVSTVDEAHGVAARYRREQVRLCGERDGLKIDGFDLGNSPLEYTPSAVAGKTLVVTTTNGTNALLSAAKHAVRVLAASLINARLTAQRIAELTPSDVLFVCAGGNGRFSLEDTIAAGAIVELLDEVCATPVTPCDGARAAQLLYRQHKGALAETLRSTDHGMRLESLGLGADVEFCSAENLSEVPAVEFAQGRLRPLA